MGIGSILPSVHKNHGWQGQYHRMIRWYKKFLQTDPGDFENPNIDEQHDILFACFQNIFYLKDWLVCDAKMSKQELQTFIDSHIQLRLCRDICNGTKHFELNNASVEADFTIIREHNPFHEALRKPNNNIIILSGGHKFELKQLAEQCINLWEAFISQSVLTRKGI